ncbi:MAG TPA: hypothetical protein VFU80_03145 [Sphingomicrobium sp.]|nr:hypothetical protein [Sphingomicrobium sp.]
MSAPVRFLALLVVGWAGMRAFTLGYIPGFTVSYAKQAPDPVPPVVATEFPPLPPVNPSPAQLWSQQQLPFAYAYPIPPVPRATVYYLPYPYAAPARAASAPIPPRPQWQLPPPGPDFYTPIIPIDDWDVSEIASASFPERRSNPVPPVLTQNRARPRLDRIQMSSWALLRGAPSPGALAAGGTLGGSQAGARLTYAFNRWIAASLRTTSPIGGSRGAEVAGGIRLTPFRSIPIAITAERRQAISRHGGGRSAFALFAEGGLYRQPMPLNFNLDAYLQAGIVGLRSRDYFADGAFAFTRPAYGRFSAGFGVWGGVQPGLYRLDVGPRVSFRLRDNIHAHLDWRQRIVGNAEPASGPAVTFAADF